MNESEMLMNTYASGFNEELFMELNLFYKEFWSNDDEREVTIRRILNYKINNIPLMMINNIERLVKLSDDIIKIRRGETLRVFFIVVCIETLYTISNVKMKKQDMVIDFFKNMILECDKKTITENFRTILEDDSDDGTNNIETFALIINEVRNIFVHEGIAYTIAFADSDTSMVNVIKTHLVKGDQLIDIGYELGMTFLVFRTICVKGFINLLLKYFDKLSYL